MKKMKIIRVSVGWVFIGALISIGCSVDARGGGDGKKEEKIRTVIDRFRLSGDRRDLSLAASALHEDFALHYRGPDGWVRTDLQGYKGALAAEVIGGEERTMAIERVEITGPVASAHVIFTAGEATFDQFITLIETPEGWQIVGIVLHFSPHGGA